MSKYLLIFLALTVVVALTGCETVKGVGRDITGVSSTLQEQMGGHRNQQ